MAELAAIGAAASIIGLIDFTAKVIQRLQEYQSLVEDIPAALKQVATELPLLKLTLHKLEAAFQKGQMDPDVETAVLPVFKDCNHALQAMETMLAKILPKEGESLWKKPGKALKSLHYDAKIDGTIAQVRTHVKSLVLVSLSLDTFQDSRLRKMREWIRDFRAPDPSSYHHRASKRRHAGTGQWFLEGRQYALWKTCPNSMLWLNGIPGCGKSALSSTIISDIEKTCATDPDKVLAYFFITFSDPMTQEPENMVKTLITHLGMHCVQVPTEVSQAYKAAHLDVNNLRPL